MREQVDPLLQQVEVLRPPPEKLTDEVLRRIMDGYVLRGADDGKYAWRAAREAGRETEVAALAGAMAREIELTGVDRSRGLIVIASRAAFDAGVAIATRDLIGTAFYGQSDYDRLAYPWRQGFPEDL